MNFSFVTLAAVMVMCVAAASSCLFALLCEKIFRRGFGRYRLVFSVLFLSAAIICISLLLIFVPFPHNFSRIDAIYYGIVFAVSFIAIFLPHVVGIPVALFYSVYVIICVFTLNANFNGSQDLYEVSLSPTLYEINGTRVEVDPLLFSAENSDDGVSQNSDNPFLYVNFTVVVPPAVLLLPMRKVWLRTEGISGRSDENSIVSDTSDNFTDSLVYRLLTFSGHFSSQLAGSAPEESAVRRYSVPLELAQFYPVVYGIMPIMEENSLEFKTRRLF